MSDLYYILANRYKNSSNLEGKLPKTRFLYQIMYQLCPKFEPVRPKFNPVCPIFAPVYKINDTHDKINKYGK